MRNRFNWIILIIILVIKGSILGQPAGNVAGIVQTVEGNRGLADVLVKVVELDRSTRTDSTGFFAFRRIPAGRYSLTFMAPSYGKTVRLNVDVFEDQTWYDEVYLQKGASEDEKFYIGGIEVTADRELLPDQTATTTRIHSGEIEHIQASSLGDVLELIPGQKFTNPGLEDVKQIQLRQLETVDEADRNAALGTQVLMDEIPISNNANMQIDTKLNDATTYRVTVNSGIDLRKIPADNIESIEVIRGIPSAKFGDLTSGAIVVDTKSGYVPFRTKYKYNPRNQELNASGGYAWQNHEMNFNVNYARSLRNIRIDNDVFSRIGLQAGLFGHYWEDRLTVVNRFNYTRVLDEQDRREGDILQTERYNRSFDTRLSGKIQYEWSNQQRLKWLYALNLDRQNSYIKKIVSRDIGVIGVRMQPGVHEGLFVQEYMSQLQVKGRAWNVFTQIDYQNQWMRGNWLHKWVMGITARHELNNGPGRQFDPAKPPRNSANEGDRPRSYTDIPGMTQLALFTEDEITGHWFRDFTLQLGVRWEMFGFTGLAWDNPKKFVQTDFGHFLNPRLNFVVYAGRNTQIRMGYGRTVKSPTLSMVYPNPVYFDVVDSVYYDTENPENRLAVVNTQVIDRTNTDIRAFTRNKYELSIDRKFGNMGFSLTAFHETMHNGFEMGGYNAFLAIKYSRPHWPQVQPAMPKDSLVLDYRRAINSVESKTGGLEWSLTTKRLPWLNTQIRVDAAYHHTESWWQDNHFQFAATQRYESNLQREVIPFWTPTGRISQQLLIHYRFDSLIRELGLWFTLNIQQLALERNK
ncbi:MAG: TonB-dependent receptor plug domain-containing protein, partial [Caldithrix sp.]|nr:TonB-dependent receptor plug domain-containing protein [Caldithrix sp.]